MARGMRTRVRWLDGNVTVDNPSAALTIDNLVLISATQVADILDNGGLHKRTVGYLSMRNTSTTLVNFVSAGLMKVQLDSGGAFGTMDPSNATSTGDSPWLWTYHRALMPATANAANAHEICHVNLDINVARKFAANDSLVMFVIGSQATSHTIWTRHLFQV